MLCIQGKCFVALQNNLHQSYASDTLGRQEQRTQQTQAWWYEKFIDKSSSTSPHKSGSLQGPWPEDHIGGLDLASMQCSEVFCVTFHVDILDNARLPCWSNYLNNFLASFASCFNPTCCCEVNQPTDCNLYTACKAQLCAWFCLITISSFDTFVVRLKKDFLPRQSIERRGPEIAFAVCQISAQRKWNTLCGSDWAVRMFSTLPPHLDSCHPAMSQSANLVQNPVSASITQLNILFHQLNTNLHVCLTSIRSPSTKACMIHWSAFS